MSITNQCQRFTYAQKLNLKIIKQKSQKQQKMFLRINKTQNDIFKNYLAQRNCNGSKTYRDSRDLDAQIKISDKSTHSEQALLKHLQIRPRDSPELCYASQHIFNILQQSINGQSTLLLRSGSQRNVAYISQFKTKIPDPKFNKIKTLLEHTKTFHTTTTDPYKLNYDQLFTHNLFKYVKVDKNKIQSILNIANQVKNTLDSLNQLLIQQEKTSSIISNLISNKLSSIDSIESIQTLE